MADTFSVLSDREGRLSAASKGTRGAVGQTDEVLRAKPIFELFADSDRNVVAEALKSASRTSETVLPGLRIVPGGEGEVLFDVRIEPAGPEKFWVHFAPVTGKGAAPASKEDFLNAITKRLSVPGGADMRLFMFDFAGLRNDGLAARLGGEAAKGMRAGIEGALSDAAIDGQVGRLEAGSYGVLGAADQDEAALMASVLEVAGRMGVSEADLEASSESVALGAEETDPKTLRGLLSHVCHKFYQTVRNGADFGADRLCDVSAEIEHATKLIDTALERGDVTISMRDVRRLASGDVTQYLVHGALVFGDEEVSANQLLVMDDYPDLCSRHDRAIAVAAVGSLSDVGEGIPVFVDVGVATLESGEAARIAADLLADGATIGFRPIGLDLAGKRSRAVRQVYRLLKEGVPVWLANFSTAIAETKRLKGAYVEVSATLLRDIGARPDRNILLDHLLKIWNDVEVRLVAVNVDSKNLASFVSRLGIGYGIGIAADPAADAPQSSRDATG